MEILEIKAARVFEQETTRSKNDGKSGFQIALWEYIELFTLPHLRKRTIIACLLQIIQQFTGISTFLRNLWNKVD
jgi:hypothetical protein